MISYNFSVKVWFFSNLINFNMCFGCSKDLSHWVPTFTFGWKKRNSSSQIHSSLFADGVTDMLCNVIIKMIWSGKMSFVVNLWLHHSWNIDILCFTRRYKCKIPKIFISFMYVFNIPAPAKYRLIRQGNPCLQGEWIIPNITTAPLPN